MVSLERRKKNSAVLLTSCSFKDATGLDFENGAIISNSKRHPPLIYDPFAKGINWILEKITKAIIDLETKYLDLLVDRRKCPVGLTDIDRLRRNPEDMQAIEKSFLSGTSTLYSNCSEIDSLLLPMIYYKNAMMEPPGMEGWWSRSLTKFKHEC